MQVTRPMARAALQGHELMPRTRGGGVAGIDYEDEHEAFAASRSSDYIYECGNEAAFDALDSHAETIEGVLHTCIIGFSLRSILSFE